MKKPFVYIAGPYTRPDPVVNVRNAILAGERLYKKGLFPYVPHLSMLWHLVSPHEDIEHWYEFDLNAIDHADALLRLPGDSTGADREVAYAIKIGVPVFYMEDELVEYFHHYAP